ncbi:DUF4132 domain-containing protein [uncultured Micrococcus sp.]|uniref:DUF4132 domain-containing protein n=1 Tax=uncultured Micrococcus sp. TaxID=114051 RepID=UPI0025FE5819|nr:DUF4132 domain-containing protein [uncultured Micrococcus sp.]
MSESTTSWTTGPWIEVPTGHAIRLHGGEVECRNAKGKVLATVPPAVKRTDEHERLAVLADSLAAHRRQQRQAVETWMLWGAAVPSALLAALWADPDAREALHGVLLQEPASACTGLLVDVDAGRLVLAGPDGARISAADGPVTVAHPALVEDVERWRAALADQGVEQHADQLARTVFRSGQVDWLRPAEDGPEGPYVLVYTAGPAAHRDYARRMSALLPLDAELSPGRIAVRVREGGRTVVARLEIDGDSPENPSYTDRLAWFDESGRRLTFEEIGPLAWSEGVRLAWRVQRTAERVEDVRPI